MEMDFVEQSVVGVRAPNDAEIGRYADAADDLGELETNLERGGTH